MPDCSQCKIKPGPICWQKCKGPADTNNHGQTHVSIEEVKGFIQAPIPVEAPTDYDAAIHFIRSLCGMRMIEREIVFSRIMGEEFPSITSRLNTLLYKRITVQGVHSRAKKALRDPAFAELFKTMLVKQHKRKTKGHAR